MTTVSPRDQRYPAKDAAVQSSRSSRSAIEDRVAEALVEYFSALDRGEPPPRNALLEEYEDVADELVACLDGLDFIHSVGPQLGEAKSRDEAEERKGIRPLAAVGDFRIVREIGRGGMGVVYEADQLSLGRRVALKVLPFAALLTESQLNRFQNEARAAATLSHPHIVPVYCVGAERGVHYYAMQLVEGQSMAAMIEQLSTGQEAASDPHGDDGDQESHVRDTKTPSQTPRPSQGSTVSAASFRTSVQLGIQAAEALDYAHRRGVIHRDIKPANIMIDGDGRTALITDFGLARVEDDATMTVTGDVLGTLAYMSPEQALGKRTVDHRADIYSLGSTLYELITHERSVQGTDRQSLLNSIASSDPPSPRRANPAVPVDLDTIIRKAMRQEPSDRYQTAQEFADDLRRYLEHKTILAKPPTFKDRLRKWLHRNPVIVASTVVVLLMGMISFALSTTFVTRAYRDQAELRQDAEEAAAEIDRQRMRAERSFALAELDRGIRLLNDGDSLGLLDLLEAYSEVREHPELSESLAYRCTIAHQFFANELIEILPGACAVEFSPDGRWLLTASGKTVQLWSTVDLQPQSPPMQLPETVHAATFSPNGRYVAAHSVYGVTRVWETATGHPATPVLRGSQESCESVVVRAPEMKRTLVFSPSGERIAASAGDGVAQLWEVASGRPLGQPLRHDCLGFLALAFSPDEQWLATAGKDGMARLWDASTGLPGRLEWTHGSDSGWPKVLFSPDSAMLYINGDDQLIACEVASGQQRYQINVGSIEDIAFSPDGTLLATAGLDGTVKLWEPCSGEPVLEPLKHAGRARDIEFSSTGGLLVSASLAGAAHVWDTAMGRLRGTPLRHLKRVHRVAIHPNGQLLASAGNSKRGGDTRIWKLDGGPRGRLLRWAESVQHNPSRTPTSLDLANSGEDDWTWESWCVAVSPDLSLAATGSEDGTVQLWNVATGRPHGEPLLHDRIVFSMAFSPDGQTLATGGDGGGVRLWDLGPSEPLSTEVAVEAAVCALTFSPNGKQLAIGTLGWSAEVWDINTQSRTHEFALEERCFAVAFSPDGALLATGTRGGAIQQWELATGNLHGPEMRHSDQVVKLAFGPDNRWLAAVDMDDDFHVSVRLWSVEEGLFHQGIQLPICPARTLLMFTRDGDLVTSGPEAGTARIWRFPRSITSLQEMQLLTCTALGAQRGPYGDAIAIPQDQWRTLRDELRVLQQK